MNREAFQAFAVANQELKSVIASYRARLAEAQQPLFDKSQESWGHFRDAACEFESSGSVDDVSYSKIFLGCLESVTRDRLEQIKHLINCETEDLSCPVLKSDI